MATDDTDTDHPDDAEPLPTATASRAPRETEADPLRWVRRACFIGALAIGWVFIGWQNRFYLTAPVIIVGLAYLAVLSTIYALWRTGVVAVADEAEDEGADSTWGRPAGRRGELEREKRTLLKAIKEAEFDREMGKLSAKDAEEMIAVYRLRAIETIKELDHLEVGDAGSVRAQIEREVKARLEMDNKASKARTEAKADAARDKKRKSRKSPEAIKAELAKPAPETEAEKEADKAEKAAEAQADARDADMHDPPSEHDSTVSPGEAKAAER